MRCLLCSAALLCFQLNFTLNSTLNLCRACFLTAHPYLLRSIWRGTCPVCKRCLSHNERSAFITTESDFKKTEKGSAAVTVLPFNSFPYKLFAFQYKFNLFYSFHSFSTRPHCTDFYLRIPFISWNVYRFPHTLCRYYFSTWNKPRWLRRNDAWRSFIVKTQNLFRLHCFFTSQDTNR